jgi:hypothetical protein
MLVLSLCSGGGRTESVSPLWSLVATIDDITCSVLDTLLMTMVHVYLNNIEFVVM